MTHAPKDDFQQTTPSTDGAHVPKYSIVVPVFNESESLDQLHSEISSVAFDEGYDIELIFVDDGSTDESWKEIKRIATHDPRVFGIQFRRNFGKAAALNAGFRNSRGEIIFTLDADLQDDPKEMPNFLVQIEAGKDCVSGWKKIRHDPWHKTLPSKIFNWMVGALTGVKLNDHNCGFKCYRREIFDEVQLYGERHRFVPVLAASHGWKIGEVPVDHRARIHGVSKYGFTRFVKGFLDLLTVYFLTGFRRRPQHLLGTLGIFALSFGTLGMLYMTIYWVLRMTVESAASWDPVHERPMLIYALGAMLLGVQLISIGFLAELITESTKRDNKPYSVKEVAHFDSPSQNQSS